MYSYIINGEKSLDGKVRISGAKNAALPILAGAILNDGVTTITNIPNIQDINTTLKILQDLGCKLAIKRDKIIIDSSNIISQKISAELMKQMRSSVIMAGALIGRFKRAEFSYPGGCEIGKRPIDMHMNGFKKLGINITEECGLIRCNCDKIIGAKIDLDFPSVGATENLILVATLAEGETIIRNSAREPEIIDLQNFLNSMGANIVGAGTSTIRILGVKKLHQTDYKIMPDRIETGTFLCIVATNGGKVEVYDTEPMNMIATIRKLEQCGCKINIEKNSIMLVAPKRLQSIQISTMPYPGFPTDMQQIFGAMLCNAKGTSVVRENIFENRFKYLKELEKMGAKTIVKGRTAIIKGIDSLYGAEVNASDLRGGVALVTAGLSAKGFTRVNNIEYILRGYENFDKKLKSIGAEITIKEGG